MLVLEEPLPLLHIACKQVCQCNLTGALEPRIIAAWSICTALFEAVPIRRDVILLDIVECGNVGLSVSAQCLNCPCLYVHRNDVLIHGDSVFLGANPEIPT